MKYLKLPLLVLAFLLIMAYAIKMPVIVIRVTDDARFNFDAQVLQQHVRVLSEELLPRTCEKPLALQKSMQYIQRQLAKTTSSARLQTYQHRGGVYSNISDHRNYWALDYPAVMVTDTAFYRNLNYHTAADTWETLDYDAMSEIVYGVYVHIVEMANNQ